MFLYTSQIDRILSSISQHVNMAQLIYDLNLTSIIVGSLAKTFLYNASQSTSYGQVILYGGKASDKERVGVKCAHLNGGKSSNIRLCRKHSLANIANALRL